MHCGIFYDVMVRETKSVRISSEALSTLQELSKEYGVTIVKMLDNLLGLNKIWNIEREIELGEALTQRDERLEQLRLANTKQPKSITKPPNAVLESAILYAFKEYKKTSLPRQKIKEYVISKMLDTKPHDKSWSEVFPEWWKDYNRNASPFEYDFDNRLKRLRTMGAVEKDPNDSVFTHKLTKKHWDRVIEMNSVYPTVLEVEKLFPKGIL